jgi:pyruvate,water dikinase
MLFVFGFGDISACYSKASALAESVEIRKSELKADMISGTLKKYDCALIQEKLDILGRLFGAVRLMDMVLSDDQQIDWYVDEFFKGNYSFQAHD